VPQARDWQPDRVPKRVNVMVRMALLIGTGVIDVVERAVDEDLAGIGALLLGTPDPAGGVERMAQQELLASR
jgi:hypothetical protein